MSAAWDWGPDGVAAHVGAALPEHGAPGHPERLTGGLLNVVWRVPLGDRSVIAKITPPFVASLPDVPLDPCRQRVEAAALASFAPDGPLAALASEAVRPPRLLHHDPARSVLLMEDVGDHPDLGEALASLGADPVAVGDALGTFLGRLHATPVTDALRDAWSNPSAQETRRVVQYQAVGGLLADAGVPDAAALGREAQALGDRLLRPGRCLIHGDLWPPSVLVLPGGRLRLIDWELAHVGVPGQDLGHLAAHLWLLGRRRPECAERARALWDALLRGYVVAAGDALPRLLPSDAVSDAARHAGCEVLLRVAGPFREETPAPGTVHEAVTYAASALRRPEASALFDTLR